MIPIIRLQKRKIQLKFPNYFFFLKTELYQSWTQSSEMVPFLNYGNCAVPEKRWAASWEELDEYASKYTAEPDQSK
jgi:hypothetical protein